MGRNVEMDYDPDEIGIPNDMDVDDIGLDESYERYQVYDAYLPDMIHDLRPLGDRAIQAATSAETAMQQVSSRLMPSHGSDAVAWLLLHKEAVSTTRFEGYHVTDESLLDYRAARLSGASVPGQVDEAVAMDAVEAIRDMVTTVPDQLTLSDLCLMDDVFTCHDGHNGACGQLRDMPVWVGGESLFDPGAYVPPPADELEPYMDDLLAFVNDPRGTGHPVLDAAIAHAQLVTVHPFADGNGRTSRLLAQVQLRRHGLPGEPVMPISSVVCARPDGYVAALESYRSVNGPADPNRFAVWFAKACETSAGQALLLGQRLEDARRDWSHRVAAHDVTVDRAMDAFVATPVMTRAMLSHELRRDASSSIDTLLDAGIVERRQSAFAGVDVYVARDMTNALSAMDDVYGLSLRTVRAMLADEPGEGMPVTGPVAE